MSTPLPPLREVIKTHGLTASKALGQNFLLDEKLLDRIAAIPGDISGANVYEVGPGPGGLTRALLRAGAHVVAVERDHRCLPALAEVSAAFDNRLRVIDGDAMKIDPAGEFSGPYHIAANLPYNVGTALLIDWMSGEDLPPRWQSLTLMFQREVADRIAAKVGDDAYGRLSVLCQWRSTARLAMPVHRSAFTPPPKIMSAVVHLTPAPMPDGVSAKVLESLTAAAFGQRRKMLRQSLKGVPAALDALRAIGLAETLRAENVSVVEFVALAKALGQIRG
jgi:16S rRNA (adenine1518-N6/adenine1519-N6)-dimethyltransferase